MADTTAFQKLLSAPDNYSDSTATEIYLKQIDKILFTNMDSAKSMYLEMAEFGRRHSKNLMVAKAYYTYGFLAQYRGDFETQEEYILKALPYLGKSPYLKGDFYGALGLVYTRLNQMDLAESFSDSSIYYSVLTQDSTLMNTAYMNKAELYNKTSKYNSAIEYALKALPLVPSTNLLRKYGIYKWLGKNYANISDYTKSISYSNKALSIAENNNYKRSQAEIYEQLGNIYLAKKNYQEAKDYYVKSLHFFEEKKPGFQLLDIYSHLIYSNIQLGNISEAQPLVNKAKSVFKKVENPQRTFLYHWALAHYYLAREQNQLAQKEFETLLNNGRKYGRLGSIISAYEGLKILAAQQNRWRESALYGDSILHYRSKKDIAHQRNTVYDLETKYNTAIKNANIKRLEDESRINALTINQKNKQVYFLLGGLFFAITTLVGFIYAYRTKQKSNKELTDVNVKLSKSLERNQSLVKEIHHRVKNNLQVVSSLLNLQGRFEKDSNVQQAIRSGKDRVHSIALLHKRLYENEDLSTVNVKSYFTELIHHIVHTFQGRDHGLEIHLDIDELDLDIDSVVPLGLITNELVTNSMKYAFHDHDHPRLKFGLKVSTNQSAILYVEDNGPGLPYNSLPTNPKSLGIQLIKSFARRMDADIEIINKEGSLIKITFPVEYLNLT